MVQKRIILPNSAAMAVSLGAWATPGSAQTLDELKAQIQEMSKRLQELETKQDQLEKKTDQTVADSQTVTSGKKGVKLTISGQVNRGVLFADNGDDSEIFYVDNDNSSTRVRFIGAGKLDDDISVGTQIEVQFESNSTAAISFKEGSKPGKVRANRRIPDICYDLNVVCITDHNLIVELDFRTNWNP